MKTVDVSEWDGGVDEAAAEVHVLEDTVVEARLDSVAHQQVDGGRDGHRVVGRLVRVVVVVGHRFRVHQQRHLGKHRITKRNRQSIDP